MRKNKKTAIKLKDPSPEEALRFLEDIQMMSAHLDEPTVAISLRVPANILRSLKLKAKIENSKYQSIIIKYIRQGLSKK